MTVTLEFVGGPLDGERQEFSRRPGQWRIPLWSSHPILSAAAPTAISPTFREGVYVRATMRKGQRVGDRTYLVDTDVLRWEGER